jgi:glutathione S-transferase
VLGTDNAGPCGNDMSIADYHAESHVALAEVIGSDLAAYPNVKRRLGRMKALKSWPHVFQVVDGFAASLKGKAVIAV